MKHLFSALLLLLTCAAASAQFGNHPKIAIAALAGDELVLSRYRLASGINPAKRSNERFDLPGLGLNAILARAAEREVREACPRCERSLLGLTPELSRLQNAVVNDSKPVDDLIVPYLNAAQENNYAYLIIITRHRAPMRALTVNSNTKLGDVDGLGFYLDPDTNIRYSKTGAPVKGFLSAFAYLRLILVDVQAERIVSGRQSTATYIYTNYAEDNKIDKQWDSLSAKDKAQTLETLADQVIGAQLPGMLRFLQKK
jgi:hypothetical protein